MEIGVDCAWGVGYSEVSADSEVVQNRGVTHSEAHVGPFYNVQPYLYWACAGQSASSACQPNGPADGFEWNFSFGNGFQGTNLVGNNFM
jgi:hypothetical protein